MKKIVKFFNSEQAVFLSSVLVVLLAFAATLPSFSIWLGLPPEGDAVDYRVSLIRYLAATWNIPNWQFTFVDDYPILGEILFAIFFSVHPNLMRLLPVLSYLGLAFFGAKFFIELNPSISISRRTLFWLAMAWIVALRPVGIQSNLLMLDNFCAFLMVGSFYFLFQKRIPLAGLFYALALASRYNAWSVASAFAIFAFLQGEDWRQRFRYLVQFSLISVVGAAPFLVRNFILNRNPFYPLFTSYFNGVPSDIAYFIYGRGTDLLSFLLLPFDLLYTNSFKQAYFDYTLGKLFYVQLLVFFLYVVWNMFFGRVTKAIKFRFDLLLFSFLFLVLWFKGSQQMRFLVPLLVVVNVLMLAYLIRNSAYWILVTVTALGAFSILSIQKDSILMSLGKKQGIFEHSRILAEECFSHVPTSERIGYLQRDGILGYFDRPFEFLPPHPYTSPGSEFNPKIVKYIYTTKEIEGFEPWPKEKPCLMMRMSDL